MALIIFDLDGTLAHTAPDLLGTLNRIIEPFGLEKVRLENVGHVVGRGAKAMIVKAFELNGRSLNEQDADVLFGQFLEDYSFNIVNETRLFPGVLAAMDRLENDGHVFAVCTNKRESMARLLLDKLDIMQRFEALTGGDTFAFNKPDGRHLIETAKLAGKPIEQAIMIGDSLPDIAAARDAKIPSIGVTFGYSETPVAELEPSAIINDFAELPKIVRKLLSLNAA